MAATEDVFAEGAGLHHPLNACCFRDQCKAMERALAESRAEVGRLRVQVDVATEACWQQIQFQEQAQARADRLVEAVQEVVAHCSASADGMGPDSGWIIERLRAALEQEPQE